MTPGMLCALCALYLASLAHAQYTQQPHHRQRSNVTCTLDVSSGQAVRSSMINAFRAANTDFSDKEVTHHYELMYIPHLARFYRAAFRMLEIGVERGHSVDLWSRMFPNIQHIYGFGKNKNFENLGQKREVGPKATIYNGDQSDASTLDFIIQDIGATGLLDVILDDGSHFPAHQIFTFEVLFDKLLAPGGTYIIEDIETSYWDGPKAKVYAYEIKGAGSGKEGSIVERFKSVADVLNRKYMISPEFRYTHTYIHTNIHTNKHTYYTHTNIHTHTCNLHIHTARPLL
jgi:hypothetical protein